MNRSCASETYICTCYFACVGQSRAKKQKIKSEKQLELKLKGNAADMHTIETADVDITKSFAGTLVVVPPTLVQQWVNEMRKHSDINLSLIHI